MPNDANQDPYVDPEYTEENRYLPKKFDILTGVVTTEEAEKLREFITSKLPNTSEDSSSQSHVLPYRSDEWDSDGIINRLQSLARDHVRATFHTIGAVEPRKFMLLRTDASQSYSETYGNYINNREILYTAVVTPVSEFSHSPDETVYTTNGEGFKPSQVDMVVHRNEEYNNWSIPELDSGSRLDLIMVFREVDQSISYDYPMDQLEETDEKY